MSMDDLIARLEKLEQAATPAALLEAPIDIQPEPEAPIILPDATPKLAGISSRTTWSYRVVNEALVPREYLMLDTKKIGAVVRALKDSTKIPGIEAYPDVGIAAKSF